MDVLEVSKKQVVELERENRGLIESKREKARLEHFLKERVKELNCLYGISQLVEQRGGSLDELLQGIVELLPPSWQYPEVTCARITFESREYLTANFTPTRWRQTSTINIKDNEVGAVEVYYLEERKPIDEGPFLKEERFLINAIAERIGRIAQRIRAEQQLQTEHRALENMNITLREVLQKVQDEKREVGRAVQANVEKIVIPILYALRDVVSSGQAGYIDLLERNLSEIASPFVNKLARTFMSLSPAEIRICHMIKNGLSTKEIAKLRNLSPSTVSRHREHIRRKLGLTNKSVNLPTYLHTFMSADTADTSLPV